MMSIADRRIHELMVTPISPLSPQTSLIEAFWILNTMSIHSLPVCNDSGDIEGIISMSDIVRYFPPTQQAFRMVRADSVYPINTIPQMQIADIMTSDVLTVDADDTINVALDLLTRRHAINDKRQYITSMPVLTNKRVVGTISYIDLLKQFNSYAFYVVDCMVRERIPTVLLTDTLDIAHQLMKSFGHRYILVVDADEKAVGMLSDIQVTRYMSASYNFSKLSIDSAMTDLTLFTTLSPNDNLQKAVAILVNPSTLLRAFPVIHHSRLVGLISYLDLLQIMKIHNDSSLPMPTVDL